LATRVSRSVYFRGGLGIALAAVAHFLAIMLAGAGHGWTTPFFVSLLLYATLPAALMLLWPRHVSVLAGPPVCIVILGIAIAADWQLISMTLDEAPEFTAFFRINGALGLILAALWLAIWTSWQALAAYALLHWSWSRQ
jgi:hypothetical protein